MYGWSKHTSADRNDRTDSFDSDFRRRRHQGQSHFQSSRHGRQRRDTVLAIMITCRFFFEGPHC